MGHQLDLKNKFLSERFKAAICNISFLNFLMVSDKFCIQRLCVQHLKELKSHSNSLFFSPSLLHTYHALHTRTHKHTKTQARAHKQIRIGPEEIFPKILLLATDLYPWFVTIHFSLVCFIWNTMCGLHEAIISEIVDLTQKFFFEISKNFVIFDVS